MTLIGDIKPAEEQIFEFRAFERKARLLRVQMHEIQKLME